MRIANYAITRMATNSTYAYYYYNNSKQILMVLNTQFNIINYSMYESQFFDRYLDLHTPHTVIRGGAYTKQFCY